MTSTPSPARPPEFIVTREYRRFIEFCDECRRARYIGLCYGVPGVGKTVSARQYAHWDELEAVLGSPPHRHDGIPPRDSGPWRTVLYTPGVVNTPRIVERDLAGLWRAVSGLARRAVQQTEPAQAAHVPDLLIVDLCRLWDYADPCQCEGLWGSGGARADPPGGRHNHRLSRNARSGSGAR